MNDTSASRCQGQEEVHDTLCTMMMSLNFAWPILAPATKPNQSINQSIIKLLVSRNRLEPDWFSREISLWITEFHVCKSPSQWLCGDLTADGLFASPPLLGFSADTIQQTACLNRNWLLFLVPEELDFQSRLKGYLLLETACSTVSQKWTKTPHPDGSCCKTRLPELECRWIMTGHRLRWRQEAGHHPEGHEVQPETHFWVGDSFWPDAYEPLFFSFLVLC
ncbi:hypothetical protein AVEN_100333-1 [Araneus ventricosus]|uniref:Uncharacterized protein n=1 Tax=Araneus ventricosus TaxID=182803 RepID=A0A4Y2UC06_ARAVE|nr:hypothetical protein AVEN_100333-1 [Araneus ventricosus]